MRLPPLPGERSEWVLRDILHHSSEELEALKKGKVINDTV